MGEGSAEGVSAGVGEAVACPLPGGGVAGTPRAFRSAGSTARTTPSPASASSPSTRWRSRSTVVVTPEGAGAGSWAGRTVAESAGWVLNSVEAGGDRATVLRAMSSEGEAVTGMTVVTPVALLGVASLDQMSRLRSLATVVAP